MAKRKQAKYNEITIRKRSEASDPALWKKIGMKKNMTVPYSDGSKAKVGCFKGFKRCPDGFRVLRSKKLLAKFDCKHRSCVLQNKN